jgi:hypothetical protein
MISATPAMYPTRIGRDSRSAATPRRSSQAWSMRTANAVPTWQATMPSQATVVAWR